MKIIDKNMKVSAEHSLRLSSEVYPYQHSDGEVIVFAQKEVEVKRSNELFTTDMYDANNAIRHPDVELLEENEHYKDYRFTDLIYTARLKEGPAKIEVNLLYAHNLSTIQARYASVFYYNRGKWIEADTEIDEDEKLLKALISTKGLLDEKEMIFAIFFNHYWYSPYTKVLAEAFPTWSHLHKDKNSNGQRFLNFFGMEMEELKEHFDWINRQHFIGKVDITQVDWVYAYVNKGPIPNNSVPYMQGVNKKIPVKVLEGVKDFDYNTANEGVLIDYDKGLVYTQYEYNTLYIDLEDGTSIALEKRLHQIWNTFDEFGTLLGVTRHFGEKNYRFIERILDVFRYPSNTSDIGLTHGIARDLDMIQRWRKDSHNEDIELLWQDDTHPLLIRNKSGMLLDHRTLRVDGKEIENGHGYTVDKNNNILINPRNEYKPHRISIVQGVEKYELHNREDVELHALMFEENGLATARFESWVQYIRKIAPVMWDDFQWDKGYWDTINKELTGIGYVPNHWDSNIDKWKGRYVYE